MTIENIITSVIAAFFQSLSLGIIVFKQIPNSSYCDKIKFSLIMWIYGMITFLFIPNQLRFIISIVIISLIFYFILKINDKKIILYSFCTMLLFSVSEIVVTLSMILVGFNSVEMINNVLLNLLLNILVSLFSIILITMPFVKRLLNKIMNLFSKNKNLINYLIFFLVLIYVVVAKNGFELLLKYNYFLNVFIIIGVAMIINIIIKIEIKSDQLQEMNNQMVNHVTKYEKIITEQGKANHEFKNQLMVIRGYAQMSKSQKLIDYVDTIIDDSKRTSNSYIISQLNKFPVGGIKGLLYYKLSIMDDEKIKYNMTVENGVKSSLNNLGIIMYKDITKVLGVILDNAIDASKKSKDKNIIIAVGKERGIVVFTISNSYKGKIDLNRIGTGYTSKGSGHGYGLRLVNDIMSANKNLEVTNNIDNENKHYVTKLVIKIQNKK